MKIIGASREQLEAALVTVNSHFHDNVRFAGIEQRQARRDGREVFLVTLTVNDSDEIGSARRNGRHGEWKRLAHACWHVHGTFFDALPVGTEIRTGVAFHAGDKWADFPVMLNPVLKASHACNCMEWNTGGVLPFPVNG